MTKKEIVREILTEEELQILISKDIQNPRISRLETSSFLAALPD